METTVKTAWVNLLQLALYRRARFDTLRYTTLNEKFNVNTGVSVPNGVWPTPDYLVIGDGGFVDNSNPIAPLYHSPIHASLYNHIPFIARTLDNDLNEAEQVKYRLRVVENISGTSYAFYYAMKTPSLSSPNLYRTTINRTEITARSFLPDQLGLFPTPITTAPDFTDTGTEYALASDGIAIELSIEELQEIYNAYQLKFGVATPPVISEIGIVSGLDRTFTREVGLPGALVSEEYQDSYALQINYFVDVLYLLNDLLFPAVGSPVGISKRLQVGVTEPVMMY